ncbi:Mov34/MPN/PAD-1 family protein [Virgibacillus ihumii]|uniref:Mov34/MPN/PAD-1 family protein n=1 Tax=Virgibacillus ihumii TaxID=2686091 RepID=UPI00157CFE4D|nr:M67 family metallopeptidase [Virgibacillus ihumii]
MLKKIVIPQTIYNEMLEHGRWNLPNEACGLLAGNDHHVHSIWQLKNEWKSVKRFFVSKDNVDETIKKIEYRKEQVIAVYHTHPVSAPVPSFYDIAHHPDANIKMMIISYKKNPPSAKCYTIQNSDCEECPFSIETLP